MAADSIVWDDQPAQDAGVVWDKPVPVDPRPKGNALTGTLQMLASAADRNILTPVEKGIAGTGARIFGKDPERAKQWVEDNLTIHPSNQMGDVAYNRAAQQVAPALAPIGQTVGAVDQGVGKVFGPNVQNVVRQVASTGSDLVNSLPGLGTAGRLVAGAREASVAGKAAEAATAAVARSPEEVAQVLGLRISPNAVHNTTGITTEPSLLARASAQGAGMHETVANVRHNRAQVNDVAMREIGLAPGTAVTDDAIVKANKPNAIVYNKLRDVIPTTAPDAELAKAVEAAGRGTESVLPLPPSVDALRATVLQPMNGGQLIDTIGDLRQKGYEGINAKENPDANALGNAQLDIANALESHLGRQVDSVAPSMSGAYQDARRGFAKVAAVNEARVGNNVDPQALARLNKKKGNLDGALAAIAETAVHFPDEMKTVIPKLEGIPRFLSATRAAVTLGVVPAAQSLLTKALSATRGEASFPKLGDAGPLGYYYRDKEGAFPKSSPEFSLQPPPGNAFEPNQPSILRSGERVPAAESSQTLRPSMDLQPPPGNAFSPNQPSMMRSGERIPLGEATQHLQPDVPLIPPPGRAFDPAQYDLLKMLAEKLRETK